MSEETNVCLGCGYDASRYSQFCKICGTGLLSPQPLPAEELAMELKDCADWGGRCSPEHHEFLSGLDLIFCQLCGQRLINKQAPDCQHECHEHFVSERVLNQKIIKHVLPCCIYCDMCQRTFVYEKWAEHDRHCPVAERLIIRTRIRIKNGCRCECHDSEMADIHHPHPVPCCYRCQFCRVMIDNELRFSHEADCPLKSSAPSS